MEQDLGKEQYTSHYKLSINVYTRGKLQHSNKLQHHKTRSSFNPNTSMIMAGCIELFFSGGENMNDKGSGAREVHGQEDAGTTHSGA